MPKNSIYSLNGQAFEHMSLTLAKLDTSLDKVFSTILSQNPGKIARLLSSFIEKINTNSKNDNQLVGEFANPVPGVLGSANPVITFIMQEPAIDYFASDKSIRSVYNVLLPIYGPGIASQLSKQYYPLLFVNECILNLPMLKLQQDGFQVSKALGQLLQNPDFPSSFFGIYNREKRLSHSWGHIFKLMQRVIPDLQFHSESLDKSIFKYAQIRDLNHVPSKKTPRFLVKEIIKRNFEHILRTTFKGPKVLWFANNTYLERYIGAVDFAKEICKTYKVREVPIPKDLSSIRHVKRIFKSGSHKILVTSQLSGSCAWSNNSLELISKHILK